MLKAENSVKRIQISEILSQRIGHFIEIKRLYELIMGIWKRCNGKEIRNDLLYNQLVFSALDGLFCRLINFAHDLYTLFDNEIKIHPEQVDGFMVQNRKAFNQNTPRGMFLGDWTEEMKMKVTRARVAKNKEQFNEVYDRMFPKVRKEKRGKPNHQDFDWLKNEIERNLVAIKAHRDTIVAHKDTDPSPTTTRELEGSMTYLQEFLNDLFFICTLGRYSFDLIGYAANVEATAEKMSQLILSNVEKN